MRPLVRLDPFRWFTTEELREAAVRLGEQLAGDGENLFLRVTHIDVLREIVRRQENER